MKKVNEKLRQTLRISAAVTMVVLVSFIVADSIGFYNNGVSYDMVEVDNISDNYVITSREPTVTESFLQGLSMNAEKVLLLALMLFVISYLKKEEGDKE